MDALEHLGEAQAAMMPIIGQIRNLEEPSPQLWLWARLEEPLEHALNTISDLIAQGYQQTPITDACLETQLYDLKRTAKPGPGPVMIQDVVQRWIKSDGRPYVPVILSFTIPDKGPNKQQYTEGVRIPLLNPLPLPQHGEYALVEYNDQLYVYSINVLPLASRQRWAALGDALRTLAAPGLWPAADERHRLANRPVDYQRALNQITARIHVTQGQERDKARILAARLEVAKIHVDELRTALRKPNWLTQWQEIQHMAQELAGDYYEHHIKTFAEATSSAPTYEEPQAANDTPVVEEPAPSTKKLTRSRPRRAPITQKEELSMISATLNREVIKGLRDKNTFTAYPEQGIAEHRHPFAKEKGQIIITIKPLDGEGFDTILAALNTLGDGCIDTHIAVQAIALERNGIQHIRMPFRIGPDDILEICKKKKSNGSYTPFQRAEIIKHLKTLSQARIIAVMPGPGRRRKGKTEPTIIKAEGSVIDLLSFKIGEYHTITGDEIWEQRSISVGEWITMIPELNGQTAKMLRQVLAYSAKNERYQKRLGIYLTLMFRINAKNGGKFPHDISMRALLEGAGIVPDKNHPGRFQEAIMKALEDLKRENDQKKNVIGNYWQVIDASKAGQQREVLIREQAYGWQEKWLDQTWNFSPPEDTKKHYQKLLKEASKGQEEG